MCINITHYIIIIYTIYQHNCTQNEWFMPRWNCNKSPWQITYMYITVRDNAVIFLLPYKMMSGRDIKRKKKEKEDIQCMELISSTTFDISTSTSKFFLKSCLWSEINSIFNVKTLNVLFNIFFGFLSILDIACNT